MSDSNSAVSLPTAEEMRRRLYAIEGVDQHVQDHLFPYILERLEGEPPIFVVVLNIRRAFTRYAQDDLEPQMAEIFLKFESDLPDRVLDALIDDEDIREEAKSFVLRTR